MRKMTLYHGTDFDFSEIDLNHSLAKRDFGRGFYTTTISAQAESWAKTKQNRRLSEHAYVYVYDAAIPDDFEIMHYDGVCIEWLEMVKKNRVDGGLRHPYDIVIGPVANDNTMLTVTRYVQGIYTAQEALERLRYSELNNQVSFHTERAIKCLTFVRRYSVG